MSLADILKIVDAGGSVPNVKTALFAATHVAWQTIVTGDGIDRGETGATFTPTGVAVDQATTGLVSGNGISETAMVSDDGDVDLMLADDVEVGRFTVDASSLVLRVYRCPTVPAAHRRLASHRDVGGDDNGWDWQLQTDEDLVLTYDPGGAASTTIALIGAHASGAWIADAILDDQTAGDVEVESSLDDNVPVAVLGDADGSPLFLNLVGGDSLTSADQEVALTCVRKHVDVEGTDLGALIAAIEAVMVA